MNITYDDLGQVSSGFGSLLNRGRPWVLKINPDIDVALIKLRAGRQSKAGPSQWAIHKYLEPDRGLRL